MSVEAVTMDGFDVNANIERLRAMLYAFETASGEPKVTGLDAQYDKPRHTTAFGCLDGILEAAQGFDARAVPERRIRLFGSATCQAARYVERDPEDPDDILSHGSLVDAVALTRRMIAMLKIAVPAPEKGMSAHDAILSHALAAHHAETGMKPHVDPSTGRIAKTRITSGAPYGPPKVELRGNDGSWTRIRIDEDVLQSHMPPMASFRSGETKSFRPSIFESEGDRIGWDVDAMAVMRSKASNRETTTCSG